MDLAGQGGGRVSETKMVWGRIGMTFHLTEEEFGILQAGGNDAAELIFQKVKSGAAFLDGDTYFPPPDDRPQSEGSKNYWQFSEDIEICL